MLSKPVHLLLKDLKRLKHDVMKNESMFSKGEYLNAKQKLRNIVLQLKTYKYDYAKYGKHRSKLILILNRLYKKAKWRGDRLIPDWSLYLTKELFVHYSNIKKHGLNYIV